MSREESGKYVLRTENLTKIYGSHRAVNAVDIHVKKGDITVLSERTERVSPRL